MERLREVVKKIKAISNTKGSKAKSEVFQTFKDDDDFITIIKLAYDPFVNFKIKNIGVIDSLVEPNLTYNEFLTMLTTLRDSNINKTLRTQAEELLKAAHHEDVSILKDIVQKELSIGISTKSMNKAVPNLIPVFEVMLAKPLDSTELTFPVQVDLKEDGVRCIAVVKDGSCKLFTRQGRLMSFPKLEKDFVTLSADGDLVFDCEVETKGSRTAVSGIINSNIKKGYTTDSDNLLVAQVFDVLHLEEFTSQNCRTMQKDRTAMLQKLFMVAGGNVKRVAQVESQLAYSYAKLQEISADYINNGYEGIIVKDLQGKYEFKRSSNWLKVKAVNSTTLKVVGVEQGKGKREGKVGALVCESECGVVSVNVGSGLTDDDIDTFTKTPPIGKYVEVLFNVAIQSDDYNWSLFLPRFKEVRIDKTEADTFSKIKQEHIGDLEPLKDNK